MSKARIVLRMRDRGGNLVEVTRTFQLTQKKKKLEFKALDGVISKKDDAGNVRCVGTCRAQQCVPASRATARDSQPSLR